MEKEEQENKGLGDRVEYRPAPPNHGTEPPYEESPYGESEGGSNWPTKPGSPWKGIIIQAIVALVIVFLMNSIIMPTAGKKQYIADITRLENDLMAMREVDKSLDSKVSSVTQSAQDAINAKLIEVDEKVNRVTGEIDNKVASATSSLGDYATKTSLSDTKGTLENSITNIQNSLNSVKSDLENRINNINNSDIVILKEDIVTLTNTVEDIQEELEILQEEGIVSKEPEVEIEDWGATGFSKDVWNWKNNYKLTIRNNSNKDITITELWVFIQPSVLTGSIAGVQLNTTKGSAIWGSISNISLQFYSYTDIEIEKNDTEVFYLEAVVLYSLDDGMVSGGTVGVGLEEWEES